MLIQTPEVNVVLGGKVTVRSLCDTLMQSNCLPMEIYNVEVNGVPLGPDSWDTELKDGDTVGWKVPTPKGEPITVEEAWDLFNEILDYVDNPEEHQDRYAQAYNLIKHNYEVMYSFWVLMHVAFTDELEEDSEYQNG